MQHKIIETLKIIYAHLLTVLILGPISFCPMIESSPIFPRFELAVCCPEACPLLVLLLTLLLVLEIKLLLVAMVVLFLLSTVPVFLF